MSRSGHVAFSSQREANRWVRSLETAMATRVVQDLLKEMVRLFDTMPVKELVFSQFEDAERNRRCALGVVLAARGLASTHIDSHNLLDVANALGVPWEMVSEAYAQNDDDFNSRGFESPAERWAHMRAWVALQIKEQT